jgi:hypothetical protein
VTALEDTPGNAFGISQVVELQLTAEAARAAQEFIRRSLLSSDDGGLEPSLEGPYPGSRYFDAVPRYSGLHTCNTWAAQTLRSAGLPVRARLTLLAGQLWRQVVKLAHPSRERDTARQSQGGGLPFWHTTVVPLPWGTTTVVLAGGGGLELLMQPASNPMANTALTSTFMD